MYFAKQTGGLGTPVPRKTKGSPASETLTYTLDIAEIEAHLAKYNLPAPTHSKRPAFLSFGKRKA